MKECRRMSLFYYKITRAFPGNNYLKTDSVTVEYRFESIRYQFYIILSQFRLITNTEFGIREGHTYCFIDVSLYQMTAFSRILAILLTLLTLQVCLDESLEHFSVSGFGNPVGNSDFTTVNHHFQQNHDHLWLYSSLTQGLQVSCPLSRQPVEEQRDLLSDFTATIWQPPRAG